MKTAFLFSGQGAQYVGMGKELFDRYESAKKVFLEANEALGFSISKICFEQEQQLNQTEFTQPAILTVSIAAFRVLQEYGIYPDMVSGLSLGEYSAYVASGVFSLQDAVRLVQKRGKFMTEAVPSGEGSMYAVLGLEDAVVEEICKEASLEGYVSCANYNAPGQVAIAGIAKAADKAAQLAKQKGAKMVVKLNVSGPFHTALLKPASERLAAELEKISMNDMKLPVITNVTGKRVEKKEDIVPLLIKQVMSPVRWVDCIQTLSKMGADTFIELGPGKTLSGFVKRIAKGSTIFNVENEKTMEKLLEKQKELFGRTTDVKE